MKKLLIFVFVFCLLFVSFAFAKSIITDDFELYVLTGDWDYSVKKNDDGQFVAEIVNEHWDARSDADFYLPNLSKGYVWKGEITIDDIHDEDSGDHAIDGPFFKVGSSYDNYTMIVLTRRFGVAVEQGGVDRVLDVYSYKDSTPVSEELGVMVPGTKFNFEIIKDDNLLSFKINDTFILEMDLTKADKAGDFNNFIEGEDYNIGFVGYYTAFSVKNMTLENLYEPEVTPEPIETSPPTEATEEPIPTEETKDIDKKDESKSKGLVIALVVLVVIVVGIVVFVVIKKRGK